MLCYVIVRLECNEKRFYDESDNSLLFGSLSLSLIIIFIHSMTTKYSTSI